MPVHNTAVIDSTDDNYVPIIIPIDVIVVPNEEETLKRTIMANKLTAVLHDLHKKACAKYKKYNNNQMVDLVYNLAKKTKHKFIMQNPDALDNHICSTALLYFLDHMKRVYK